METASRKIFSVRDDLTRLSGRQTLKLGGEFLAFHGETIGFGAGDNGTLAAQNGAIPANIASLFPNLSNPATWNLAPLSALSTTWTQGFGNYDAVAPKQQFAVWAQDDVTMSPRLTLNLGLRYDLERHAFANDAEILPFTPGNRPDDKKEIGPRTGFAFRATDRTVIRGGYGLYFGTVQNGYYTVIPTQAIAPVIFNDGRANFAANPFNGPIPTYETVKANVCTPRCWPGAMSRTRNRRRTVPATRCHTATRLRSDSNGRSGRRSASRPTTSIREAATFLARMARTRTSSSTRPPGSTMRPTWRAIASGRGGDTPCFRRLTESRSNYHSLRTAFTKRLSQRWQMLATYTLSGLWDAYPPPYSGIDPAPFPTSPALGGEYSLGIGDQRHRAVANAIWNLPSVCS